MTPIDRLFDNLPALPSIPRVVQELIVSLGDEDADIGPIVTRLREDQVLTARVLRLANSSHYGARQKVGAIDDAVTLIGLNALRTLVIASGVSGAFARVPGIELRAFSAHAMLSARLAKKLARSAHLHAEFAYTAALMHRIGQLLIHCAYPSVAEEIADAGPWLAGSELARIEREHLGLDHCEVGAELARRWHFPAVIQNALHWYVAPLEPEACPYACLLNITSQLAHGIETSADPDGLIASLDAQVLTGLVLNEHDWAAELEDAASYLQEAESIL